ncbi:MAG: L-threonylcarbamoyladenylate synthase [Bacteroidota bacterium]|nr:L-threonylcarbamoyladenylate synthase [Bacteroidota bacterium]MDP4227285.1 L-threonylcarbamoyladenylate synthase [Bacteroidota bacterium]MDP4274035.1 L-threonylcarbamoyladenylate synthase [Bacteroidota bacterium]
MIAEEIENALKVLKSGGTILYPTDTIWGLGCDATNAEAVSKIFKIKKRDDSKSMLVLIDSLEHISNYVKEVPSIAYDLIEVAENPLTIIYPNAKNLAANLIPPEGTIGIRIVKDDFCCQLIKKFNKPIVSTSANISGMPFPKSFREISAELLQEVDYVVKWRQNEPPSSAKPSSIIKLEVNGEIKIIRK